MNIDLFRGVVTHATAALVILIGLASLVWLTANGTISSDVGVPAVVAIVTVAGGFLFQAEVSKQAQKAAQQSFTQGQNSPAPTEPPPTI
jgi:hypothetical protein